MATNNNTKYIYELPYLQKMELCRILNQNNKWEELAGVHMQYDALTVQSLKTEKNPSDELLTLWGHLNHTITELFILLYKMHNYQALTILKPFVDEKFHKLLHNGETNLQYFYNKNSRGDKHFKVNNGNYHESQDCEQQPVPKMIARAVKKEEPNNMLPVQLSSPLLSAESDSNNLSTPSSSSKSHNAINMAVLHSKKSNNGSALMPEASLPNVSYDELTVATNGWSKLNILGRGGFGVVFKGVWKNTNVAVKRIELRDSESVENYMVQLQLSLGEIKILNSRSHENILPLYAFSLTGETPCLVYQLMQNGSLEDKLRNRHLSLSWAQRHEIAKGTARGLQYLHTIGDKPLIHGDIKTANILLDKNFEPKIGDFGLAREGPQKDSMKVTKVQGTRPYLPDEFLRNKSFSTKVDTYSFGIVLYEIGTGLNAYDSSRPNHKYLRDFIESWGNKDLTLLMDKRAGKDNDSIFMNLMNIGKWCANKRAENRPEMEFVYKKLNNFLKK